MMKINPNKIVHKQKRIFYQLITIMIMRLLLNKEKYVLCIEDLWPLVSMCICKGNRVVMIIFCLTEHMSIVMNVHVSVYDLLFLLIRSYLISEKSLAGKKYIIIYVYIFRILKFRLVIVHLQQMVIFLHHYYLVDLMVYHHQ